MTRHGFLPPWAFWPGCARNRWHDVRAAFRWRALWRCPECRMPRRRSQCHDGHVHRLDCGAWRGKYR